MSVTDVSQIDALATAILLVSLLLESSVPWQRAAWPPDPGSASP